MESAIDSERVLRLAFATDLLLPPGASFQQISDPLLQLALASGVGAILASLGLILAVVILRLGLLVRMRREQRFVAVWRPLMAQCLERAPAQVPTLAAADHDAFLRLWNHYHESLRGASKEHLNQLAEKTGMDAVARGMLARRSLRDRLVAVVTLGHLGDRTAWHEMRGLADDDSPVLSLAAARTMLRIEPAATPHWLVPLAAARSDWPLSKVAAMLAEADVDRVTPALAAALKAASEGEGAPQPVSRLLRLAEVAYAERLAPAVRRILERSRDEGVIADGLGTLRDPRDVDFARRYAAHASWMVRVAAAKALGRIGAPEDRKLLAGLLNDPNWWVRYRAARSLADLPFVSVDELRTLRASFPEGLASQTLDQVIAEKTWTFRT